SYSLGGGCRAGALPAPTQYRPHTDEPAGGRIEPDLAGEVRATLVRDSLPLVDECLRTAGLHRGQLGAILLAGGAATPPEVAHTLADTMQCPVVRGPAPAQSAAFGAALLGAQRPAADTVMVPVRRPVTRAAAAVATIAAPVLISAAAGLTSVDLSGPEHSAAKPDGRAATGLLDRSSTGPREATPVPREAGEGSAPMVSVSEWTSPPATAKPAMMWTPPERPSQPAVLDPVDPPTRATEDDSPAVAPATSTDFPVIAVYYAGPDSDSGQPLPRDQHEPPTSPPNSPPPPDSPTPPSDSPTPPPDSPTLPTNPDTPVDAAPPPSSAPAEAVPPE
ncbi:FGGY-family carbohydrate kinase, partial [Nocardia sp. NPDC058497]|uniref:FGGY-family carbohydrate kinase n=1 Tax=Nocardia sp. NPDC058497 TaxID=3346529 RepID=UPI003665BAA2